MPLCDMSLARTFTAIATELCAEHAGWYYPGRIAHEGRDGFAVRIEPEGRTAWNAVVAPSGIGMSMATMIIAHPDGNTLGVVNKGDGYLLDSRDSERWSEISVAMINDARIVSSSVVLYVGQWGAAAYGRDGMLWRRDQLADDGLKIVDVGIATVELSCWDASLQGWLPLILDINTGRRIATNRAT